MRILNFLLAERSV